MFGDTFIRMIYLIIHLHDQGYPSIGCSHCTVPAFNADDLRSGRWQGKGKTECGLHEDEVKNFINENLIKM